jgi:RNA polymerase sigma-70 factor (ECF subfamily)
MTACFERARQGDPVAVEAVLAPLRPRMERMAAFYARCSGEEADDLLQEAWVGLLEALPALDVRIGSPEQYLIQRARWRLLDAIKRARRRARTPGAPGGSPPPGELVEEVVPDCRAGSAPEAAVAAAHLHDFARRLNRTQQAVLDCLLAGLTWREAGRALGCTSANIAYHVRQIRRRYEEWQVE